jgi:hypothetical protein
LLSVSPSVESERSRSFSPESVTVGAIRSLVPSGLPVTVMAAQARGYRRTGLGHWASFWVCCAWDALAKASERTATPMALRRKLGIMVNTR